MNCAYKNAIKHEPIDDNACSEHHDHSHAHTHKITDKRALKLGIIITSVAMAVQFIYSILTNSLALLSDTLHMFSHVFALALSYFAIWLSEQKGGAQRTFGFHRAEILAAFINSLTTAIFVVFIVYEAVYKLIHPETIDAKTLIIIAILGLLVNAATGLVLLKANMQNLNIKSSFLHMMSDLLSSVAVVIGGVAVYLTGAVWIDSVLALVIAFVIGKWSYGLIRQSVDVLLEASPIAISDVKASLEAHESVTEAHDIHVSEITHNMYVLTAHIVLERADMMRFSAISRELSHMLLDKFKIGHTTFQPEFKEPFWTDERANLGSKIF